MLIKVHGYIVVGRDAKANMELFQRRGETAAELLVDGGIKANGIAPRGLWQDPSCDRNAGQCQRVQNPAGCVKTQFADLVSEA
jgi:hypothetical protein